MGLYRFALALFVVLVHFGRGQWLVGREAVFCFYLISGFVIARVIDRRYGTGSRGLLAFYSNRVLRLFPLYAAVTYASIWVLTLHGTSLFTQLSGPALEILSNSLVGASPRLVEVLPIPIYESHAGFPMIASAVGAIPQGWSIGVEMTFYLLAPVLVVISRRRAWPILVLAAVTTAQFVFVTVRAPNLDYFDNVFYKNAVTTAFMFVCGAAIYALSRKRRWRVPFSIAAPVGVIFLAYLYVIAPGDIYWTRDPQQVVVFNVLLSILPGAIICLATVPPPLRRIDAAAGSLSYGIYINHFFAALVLAWAAERTAWQVSQPWWGYSVAAASIVIATLTFFAIERPIDRLRKALKQALPTRGTTSAEVPTEHVLASTAE